MEFYVSQFKRTIINNFLNVTYNLHNEYTNKIFINYDKVYNQTLQQLVTNLGKKNSSFSI
jgi:hypothetical protein